MEQTVLDCDQVADAIILVALDGREFEVPRRGAPASIYPSPLLMPTRGPAAAP